MYLSKFDADRTYRDGTRPPCTCGCANALATWIKSCTHSAILDIRKQTVHSLRTLHLPVVLYKAVLQILDGDSGESLVRGHWTAEVTDTIMSAFFTQSYGDKALMYLYWQGKLRDVIRRLQEMGLSMYSAANLSTYPSRARTQSRPPGRQTQLPFSRSVGIQRSSTTMTHGTRQKAKPSSSQGEGQTSLATWLTRHPS